MLKRSKWNCLNLKLLLVSVLFFALISDSRELRDYNIWNDKVPGKKDAHRGASAKWWKNEGNDLDFPVEPRGREGKILSFFYPSTEFECLAEDRRRSGTCLNPYRCHQKGGTSSGFCAHGFGVCCVFTVTCGKEVKHNLTYFVSPEFPSLARSLDSCTLTVHKLEGASQLRLDFVHFNLGQPNRLTGDCDSDLFVISGGGSKDFRLCGINSGQHVYYDIDNKVKSVTMSVRLGRRALQRLWEVKVTQVPFAQRAPADCAQYFTTDSGIVESFNFAENGRHLANQNYKACVRQSKGMCSIAYEPCDEESFRIGPSLVQGNQYAMGYGDPGMFGTGPGSFGTGPGSFGNGPGYFGNGPGSFVMPGQFGGPGSEFVSGPIDQDIGGTQDVQMVGEPLDNTAEVMGSGDGPVAMRSDEDKVSSSTFWNPYTQFLSATENGDIPELWRYSGYGNYGQGVSSFGRQGCRDRIVTPCDGDEFLGTTSYSPGSCDPYHCGPSLCQGRSMPPQQMGRAGARPLCRIETSATPFFVAIKFGPPAPKPNPEANIGMCLKYEQVPCT